MNKYLPTRAFTFSSTFIFMLGVIFSASTTYADDTDVYLTPSTPPNSEPLVMFMLDHRSNLSSLTQPSCNNAGLTAADILANCNGYTTEIADAVVALGLVGGTDNDINFLDLLSAILFVTLDQLSGVEVGLLIPHQEIITGSCTTFTVGPPFEIKCSNGAYIPFGFQTLTDDTATAGVNEHDVNVQAFINTLSSLPNDALTGGQFHKWQANEMWFEYYRYLTGGPVWNGHQGYADFAGQENKNLDVAQIGNAPGPSWDATIEDGSDNYVSPIAGDCTKAFALSFSFGTITGATDSDTQLQLATTGANGGGMSDSVNTLTLSGGGNTQFEQILKHMNNIDMTDGEHTALDVDGTANVTSYFFANGPDNTDNGFADAGGGRSTAFDLSDDPDEVVADIEDIFASILSVSTTFVAPSVPVNVFNRTQTLDAVFLALFEAEEEPNWLGNLKKLTIDTTDGQLEDATGANAIDNDGRILASALTPWTNPATLPVSTDTDSTDTTDGRSVLRGGSGQNIPGFVTGTPGLANNATVTAITDADGPRKIFVENLGVADPDNLLPFNADVATATAYWTELMINVNPADVGVATIAATYGAATATEQARAINLIRFARGLLGDTTTDDTTLANWMTSDPLHSRPITINYGDNDGGGGYSETNPNIRIAMSTNDGGMRMIVNTEADGSESGREAWVFFPREALPTLNRLRDNAVGGGDPVHPYTTDGSPAAIVTDSALDGSVDGSDTVTMFFGQRRGGTCYYGMDVTDPEAPELIWKQCKTTGGGDFDELGQTWSRPTVGKMAELVINSSAAATDTIDVLVFGGGYNGDDGGTHLGCTQGTSPASHNDTDCDDTSDVLLVGKDAAHGHKPDGTTLPTIGVDDDEGNAVFVVNADDGTLIWKAIQGTTGFSSAASAYKHVDMVDSIPSELAAVDTDSNGTLDRIYFGDTGGRVWRADMPQADVDLDGDIIDEWFVTTVLDVGRHDSGNSSDETKDIRFFNRADVVQASDGNAFDAIVIGSGDRANPLGQIREDTFFMIKDRNITSGTVTITTDWPLGRSNLADLTDADCATSLTTGSCDGTNIATGWFLDLGLGVSGTGEKNLAAALTLGGTIFFSTFSPVAATSACGLSEGTGKIFAVSLLDATAVFSIDNDNDSDPDNPTYERFAELDSGGIPVETVPLGGDDILILGSDDPLRKTGATTSWKTFWYERDSDDTP